MVGIIQGASVSSSGSGGASQLSLPMLAACMLGQSYSAPAGKRRADLINAVAAALDAEHHAVGNGKEEACATRCEISCWIGGRVLLARDMLGHRPVGLSNAALQYTPELMEERLLQCTGPPVDHPAPAQQASNFACWAASYVMHSAARRQPGLAERSFYNQRRDSWLSSTDSCAASMAAVDSSSAAWACICALSASAEAGDSHAYSIFKRRLGLFDQPALDAVRQRVPSSDYRAWAVSLVAVAAAQQQDLQVADELLGGVEVRAGLIRQARAEGSCEGVLSACMFFYADYALQGPRLALAAADKGEGKPGGLDCAKACRDFQITVPNCLATLEAL
jgi:hypothetical protein